MKKLLIAALLMMAACSKKGMDLKIEKPTQADKDKAELIWLQHQPKVIK